MHSALPRLIQAFDLLLGWTVGAGGVSRRTVTRTIEVDGRLRQYRLFVPPKSQGPLSLVVALHGGGSTAWLMERFTRFSDLADQRGFAVIYPESVAMNWNDGRDCPVIPSQRDHVDDVKFIRSAVDDVARIRPIDRGRIFAMGFSNGGLMSHRLAAEASDLVAGIASVSGGLAPPIFEHFHPANPVSLLAIHGDADPCVPFDGGEIRVGSEPAHGNVVATRLTLDKYLARNGNPAEPQRQELDADPRDGTSVVISHYPDGPGGVKLWFYLVRGGGHTWPGRPLYLPERIIGKASTEFSAVQVIADFFAACPSRTATTG